MKINKKKIKWKKEGSIYVPNGTVRISKFLALTDNFDSYNNGDDLGSQRNWTNVVGSIKVTKPASDGVAESNTLNVNNWAFSRRTETWKDDQQSQVQIASLTITDVSIGPTVRNDVGGICYMAQRYYNGTSVFLTYFDGSNENTITSVTVGTLTVGEKIRISATGHGSGIRIKIDIDTGGGWTNYINYTGLAANRQINHGTPG